MNVLVLGGTRYFGRRLVSLLMRRGHRVTVASRHATTAAFDTEPVRLQILRDDVDAMRALSRQHFDVVFDQICMHSAQARLAIDVFCGNVGRYVMTSSMSVYEPNGNELPESAFDASRASRESDVPETYASGKRAAETVFAQKAPFPTVIVRAPLVVGSDDFTGRFEQHVAAVVRAKRIVFHSAQEKISMISSGTMADFLAWTAEQNFDGSINIASSEPVSAMELLRTAEGILGGTARVESSDDELDPDFSPYSTPVRFTLDTTRAQSLGYELGPVRAWLPKEIETLGAKLREPRESSPQS